MELLAIPTTTLVLALAVGRWWFMVAPVALWLILAIYLEVNDGWHGAGWGEYGVAWNAIVAALTLVCAAGATALRKSWS